MKNTVHRKIFLILLALSLISVICVFPYVLTVQGDVINQIGIPLEALFVAQFIQSIILFLIVIFFGLFFTKRVNFKLPLIESIVKKQNYQPILKNMLGISIISGILTAITIYVVDYLFTLQGIGITTHQNVAPIWQTLLASFYGGITEEILMRFFLMTFFIWIGMKVFKLSQPNKPIIITSLILAAIIFGLGHLPITASITQITPLVITRAIILNGIGGIVFGILFWKKGLESAMIAHFTTDVFLLTLLPLIFT